MKIPCDVNLNYCEQKHNNGFKPCIDYPQSYKGWGVEPLLIRGNVLRNEAFVNRNRSSLIL